MRKKFYFIITFILSLNIIFNLYAEPIQTKGFDETLPIGTLTKDDAVLWLGTEAYPIYKLCGEPLIALSDLEYIGVTIQEENQQIRLIKEDSRSETVKEKMSLKLTETLAYINDQSVYIGPIRTYSIKSEEAYFIPFRALEVLWDIEEDEGYYIIRPKTYENRWYIQIEEGKLTNISEYPLRIKYSQLYWKEDSYIEKIYEDQVIAPYESIFTEEKKYATEENAIYLTTAIEEICDIPMRDEKEDYGQKPTLIYKAYTKAKRVRSLEKIFPKYKVTAKLRYPAAGFKEGEEVELWRSENGQYHVLKRADNKKIIVPRDSIDIIKDTGKGWQPATTVEIEDYVNLKDYESDTEYLIWTDIYRQLTYIFKGEKNNWSLIKTMKCSAGKNKSLTPTGNFKIEYKVPYFGMNKGYRCKNALVFYRDYMYHSILFDITGQYIKSGQHQLGARVSHGCIRLSEEDSIWLYKNIPEFTKVYIE